MYHTLQDLYSDDFDEDADNNNYDNNNDSDTDSDDDNKQENLYISKRPISGTNRQLNYGTCDKKVLSSCVLPQYQRRSTFIGAAVISPLVKTSRSMPSLSQTSKQLPSADLQPKRKREPSHSQLLLQKMISEFALTPLKLIANELITLHHDVYPTEISPTINRSPSFIGTKDKDDGLMSGRCSPKLDIPRQRYCGRMIKQHPLARYSYKMTDQHLANIVRMQASPSSSSSSSSSYGPGDYDEDDFVSYDDDDDDPPEEPVAIPKKVSKSKIARQVKQDITVTKQQKNIKPIPKENSYLKIFINKLELTKPAKTPQPFKKPSYVEIYKKKASFSKKKVLPPIGSKPTEDKQPALVLPTPPQSRPASGQAASLRLMRRARMESKQKNKLPQLER